MGEKKKRTILTVVLLAATFLSVLVFEGFSPILSDDLSYHREVREAFSVADVVRQEVNQYLHWTGRSVAHLLLRLYLYFFGLHRAVFNVLAAAVFTLLTYFMHALLCRKEEGRYLDPILYLLLALGVWLFAPRPGQTIFWLTGCFNYLFTTAIILGFFVLFRHSLGKEAGEKSKGHLTAACVGLFFAGVLAGWCNENTSGAACLYVLMETACLFLWKKTGQEKPSRGRCAVAFTALCGVGTGFAMQLLSPGNHERASVLDERHVGLMRYVARLLKLMATVRGLFLPLLLVFLFLFAFAFRQGARLKDTAFRNAVCFFVLFAAGAGCLILSPEAQERVFFGAAIFLLVAIVQLVEVIAWEGAFLQAIRDFAVWSLCVVFVFTWVVQGGNLARIYREMNTRYALLGQAVEAGEEECVLPMLPEGFESRYSMAYETDLTDEWKDFPCAQLAESSGLVLLWGIPYEEYYKEGGE